MDITLKQYLFIKEMTVRDLAAKLECSYTYLSAIINDKILPGKRLAADIKRLTGVEIPWSKKKDRVQVTVIENTSGE